MIIPRRANGKIFGVIQMEYEYLSGIGIFQVRKLGPHGMEMEAVEHYTDIFPVYGLYDIICLAECIDRAIGIPNKFKSKLHAAGLRVVRHNVNNADCFLVNLRNCFVPYVKSRHDNDLVAINDIPDITAKLQSVHDIYESGFIAEIDKLERVKRVRFDAVMIEEGSGCALVLMMEKPVLLKKLGVSLP